MSSLGAQHRVSEITTRASVQPTLPKQGMLANIIKTTIRSTDFCGGAPYVRLCDSYYATRPPGLVTSYTSNLAETWYNSSLSQHVGSI